MADGWGRQGSSVRALACAAPGAWRISVRGRWRSRTTRWGTRIAPPTSSVRRGRARRWEAISNRSAPKFLDALEAGDAERTRLLDQASAFITDLRAAGFQRFAVKPLVSLGFRLALRDVRAHAKAEGFDPDELEDELHVFQRAFDARILYRG